ncbi:DgyrCDS12551 [Dimorphilus gyrociliatus]|uniref:DgyrCDS12551 n=1 Tax=Dimorphilus gyrociliatus TaxID=2664684 RepID=A0A7I8W6U3_9ANNE|nr:DgyrCDS12551 [Dimorphilus gyrociliatus]
MSSGENAHTKPLIEDNKEKMEPTSSKSFKIASVVALYWFVSISLVFLNKYLLSSPSLDLHCPLFVTWFQCVVTVGTCFVFSQLSRVAPQQISFPAFVIKLDILKQILPLSLVFVGMITFNNLCLTYVGVAFYYVVRSLTTVFNVILSYVILQQKTSFKLLICCGVLVFGFLLGVDQEGLVGSLSILGVLFGVGASACVALNAIYTKKFLAVVDENVWRLTLYNNVNACVLFLPLMILSGEVSKVIHFNQITSIYFWTAMTIAGVFGFAIGFVTGLQIKVTSPLTHNISGTAKACAQTIIATSYNHDVKPLLWWASNAIVLAASAAYTYLKKKEMNQKDFEEKSRLEEVVVKGKNGSDLSKV